MIIKFQTELVSPVLNMVMMMLCKHSGLAGSETSDTQ